VSDLDNSFALTDGERHHPLWIRLSAHLSEKLTHLRARNDGPLTEQETATLRGEINCLKRVIALGAEPPRLDG
jgi:hypothetical protein